MPPGCAVVCLILGLTGVVLFVVGFALPFWLVDNLRAGTTANHGLWQARECQQCDIFSIQFGVSAEFEAARVFACATVAMGIVSFCFTIVFANRPYRVWSVRCSAVWACTALFNLLTVSLFGATEAKTLEELNLGAVTTSDIGSRLGWGFWVAVASLLLFVLLALNCAFLTCSRDVSKDNDSEPAPVLAKRKRLFSRDKKMQADHMTRLYVEATRPQRTAGLYPDIHSYPAPSYPASTLTTKTAEAFRPPSTYTSNGPSVYTVNKTGKGYSIQPSSAAVNIDNRNPQLSALGTYNYRSGGVRTHYQGVPTDVEPEQRVILNRPDLTSYASTTGGGPATLSLPRQGTAYQDSQYSFNVNPSTSSGNPQSSYPAGFVVAGGPPGYASLPQQDHRNVVANFGTTSSNNLPYGVY